MNALVQQASKYPNMRDLKGVKVYRHRNIQLGIVKARINKQKRAH